MVGTLAILLAAAPHLAVTKELTPNPTVVTVPSGPSVALSELVTCPGATAGATVSKEPAVVLDIAEGMGTLDLQVSNGAQLVARDSNGVMQCSEKSKLDLSKTGAVELFVVGAGTKIRVHDPSRHRVLPASVKAIVADAKAALVFEGELAALPAEAPDFQLEVPVALGGLKWKLYGNAAEVYVTELIGEEKAPVKLSDALQPGRYAVWVRGAAKSAKGSYAVVGLPEGAALEPLQFFTRPLAETPLENRALTAFMPGLDPKALEGNANALRARAFSELPLEFFVFAAADGEALLPLSVEAGQASVIAADGATFSMAVSELSVTPGASGPKIHPARAELFEKLTLAELAPEKDPRLKSLEKLKKASDLCLEKFSAKPEKCKAKVAKTEKAQEKLEAELKKAYAKKRSAELAAVEKHLAEKFSRTP